jgi:hypothetical protein
MDLNSKFDSVLTEQTMVLKNVEGDTVKQLQLLDGKTRTVFKKIFIFLNDYAHSHFVITRGFEDNHILNLKK